MAYLHSSDAELADAIDLERLIAELERGDLARFVFRIRPGERRSVAYLDFDGERWIRRRRLAVLRGVLPEQHVRAAGSGDGSSAAARPVPAGRFDVDRHPVEHVLLQPLEHADRDGVPGQGAGVGAGLALHCRHSGTCDPFECQHGTIRCRCARERRKRG